MFSFPKRVVQCSRGRSVSDSRRQGKISNHDGTHHQTGRLLVLEQVEFFPFLISKPRLVRVIFSFLSFFFRRFFLLVVVFCAYPCRFVLIHSLALMFVRCLTLLFFIKPEGENERKKQKSWETRSECTSLRSSLSNKCKNHPFSHFC